MTDAHGTAALARGLALNETCAVIFVDAAGTIRSWNSGAERLFGYRADEAIGQKADLIVPPELREHHWQGFHRAMALSWAGSGGWGSIEPRHRSGGSIALEVLLIGIRTEPGAPLTGVVSFFRAPESVAEKQ